MNWNPERLRGLPKVTQSRDQKPACLLTHILSTDFPPCWREPNVVLISKMAITLRSFYEGIQPVIENLKTNTCDNEINLKSSLQRKIRWSMHHSCCGYTTGPHSLLWPAQCVGNSFVVGWARFHCYWALNLTPHPHFLLVEWVRLHCCMDQRGKCDTVYNVDPGQMLVPFPFALTENTIRGAWRQFFNDNRLHFIETRA